MPLVGLQCNVGRLGLSGPQERPQVPDLARPGVGAELHLQVGVLARPHHHLRVDRQPRDLRRAVDGHAQRSRLGLADSVGRPAGPLTLVVVGGGLEDEVRALAADQEDVARQALEPLVGGRGEGGRVAGQLQP